MNKPRRGVKNLQKKKMMKKKKKATTTLKHKASNFK